jgi:hypothetical protein
MSLFYNYLTKMNTLIALIIPFILSVYCFKKSIKDKPHYIYYLFFLLSIPVTSFFSSWIFQRSNTNLSIGLSIYPFFIIFMSLINILTGWKLSAYRAYFLSFYNILIIDVLCALQPSIVKNSNIFNYLDSHKQHYSNATYYMTEIYLNVSDRILAIGGNGYLDALFLYPLFTFMLFYFLEQSTD